MLHIILNGTQLTTKEEMHDYLAKMLHLPTYYGRNLDALHDCLTDIGEETELILLNWDAFDHTKRAMHVMMDSAEENGKLHIK